jgi:REP element-mobilizing transposase RayT
MTYPRKHLININQTQFYHCVSRCVRRAYLCGKDNISGRSFEHRRSWVEHRLLMLAEVFTIDVFAYAVMHNHTHIVLYVNTQENAALSDYEVLKKWGTFFKLDEVCERYTDIKTRPTLTENELVYVGSVASKIRERLMSISWFMSLLNQHIARKANKEDDCTGRFWEGRFKSQALLTEKAVLACMMYVDLNPVRAGVSNSLESSLYTSIRRRLRWAQNQEATKLLPFGIKQHLPGRSFLEEIPLSTYLDQLRNLIKSERVSSAKAIRFGKIHFNRDWVRKTRQFEREFAYAAGSSMHVQRYRELVRTGLARPQSANSLIH